MNNEKLNDLLSCLPKTTEKQLFLYDQSVHNFINWLLMSDDPLEIIDEMFTYYVPILRKQQEELIEYKKMVSTPEELKKIITFYLDNKPK